MSSIILWKTALKAEHLHTDTTYTLLWQGFSVHVIEQRTRIGQLTVMVYQFVTEKQPLLLNSPCTQ